MASIQARSGSFRVLWRQAGKQCSLTFPDRQQALAYKAQVEHQLQTGLLVDPNAASEVRVYAEQFLAGLTVRPKTAYNYRNEWSSLAEFDVGGGVFEDLPANRVTKALCQRMVAASTRPKTARTVLRQTFQIAVEQRALHTNPATSLSVPSTPVRVVNPLTAEELLAVADAAGHYSTWVLWQGLMGTRFGESAALTPQQFSNGVVTIDRSLVDYAGTRSIGPTKTGQVRALPVPNKLLERLDLDSELVFTTKRGKQLRNNNLRTGYWLPALERAGVEPRRIHDLRHTSASLLIQQGASVKAVQQWLGHTTIAQTLDVYSHLYVGDLQHVADTLDGLL